MLGQRLPVYPIGAYAGLSSWCCIWYTWHPGQVEDAPGSHAWYAMVSPNPRDRPQPTVTPDRRRQGATVCSLSCPLANITPTVPCVARYRRSSASTFSRSCQYWAGRAQRCCGGYRRHLHRVDHPLVRISTRPASSRSLSAHPPVVRSHSASPIRHTTSRRAPYSHTCPPHRSPAHLLLPALCLPCLASLN